MNERETIPEILGRIADAPGPVCTLTVAELIAATPRTRPRQRLQVATITAGQCLRLMKAGDDA